MIEKTYGNVYFYIHGDNLDPEICTALIGLTPTRLCRKGDHQGEKRPLARTGRWEIELHNDKMYEINTATEALLDVLLPSKNAIHKILQNSGVEAGIFCVVCVYDERPCLRLSTECLRKLSELGIDYEIDYYNYTECREGTDK